MCAVVLTTGGEQKAILFFAALCIVAAVAARVVFPKEVRAELQEELEELRDHGHRSGTEEAPEGEKEE